MTDQNVLPRITKIVVEHLGVKEERVTPEARIDADLGADSLDHVDLIMAIEEEFKVEIGDERAEKITTVGEAIEAVTELLK